MTTLRKLFIPGLLLFLLHTAVSAAAEEVPLSPNPEEKVLSVYLWEYAIDQETLNEFREETGVEVKLNYYLSGQDMLSYLLSGPKGYDVVIVPDRFLRVLIQSGRLEKLDKNRIKNGTHLHPHFLDLPFDPGNAYSLPYLWGTLGIAYRTDKVSEPINSWDAIFNPEEEHKGHIALLDDPREVLGAALKYKGYSFNTTEEERIREASRAVEDMLEYIRGFYYDFDRAGGEVWIAMTWNGIAYEAKSRGKPINYVVPKEGSNTWVDNLVILKDAPQKQAAYDFVNFVLRPQVAAQIADYTGFATPNREARTMTRKELRDEQGLYPPDTVLASCEYTDDIGKSVRLIYNLWRRLKEMGRKITS